MGRWISHRESRLEGALSEPVIDRNRWIRSQRPRSIHASIRSHHSDHHPTAEMKLAKGVRWCSNTGRSLLDRRSRAVLLPCPVPPFSTAHPAARGPVQRRPPSSLLHRNAITRYYMHRLQRRLGWKLIYRELGDGCGCPRCARPPGWNRTTARNCHRADDPRNHRLPPRRA
jgi:hypothetical protein